MRTLHPRTSMYTRTAAKDSALTQASGQSSLRWLTYKADNVQDESQSSHKRRRGHTVK